MNACKTRRLSKIVQVSLCSALLVTTAFTHGDNTAVPAVADVRSFAAEFSVLPKAGPTWQRPAPLTWSSRLNVRLEARWGSDGRYIA